MGLLGPFTLKAAPESVTCHPELAHPAMHGLAEDGLHGLGSSVQGQIIALTTETCVIKESAGFQASYCICKKGNDVALWEMELFIHSFPRAAGWTQTPGQVLML